LPLLLLHSDISQKFFENLESPFPQNVVRLLLLC
jgi:hypothetical protein